MAFWDGTAWVPEPTDTVERGEPGKSRRAFNAGFVTVLLCALAASSVFAAPGKQSYTLAYDGFGVWGDPYAYAYFDVTRSKADSTDVWVKAYCWDADGNKAIPGADPYGHVKWDSADPLSGRARLDSVKKGSTCEAWLTKSWKQSTGPAPGWPETYLVVDW